MRVQYLRRLVNHEVDIDLIGLVVERQKDTRLNLLWASCTVEASGLAECDFHVLQDDLMADVEIIDKERQVQVRVLLLSERVDT